MRLVCLAVFGFVATTPIAAHAQDSVPSVNLRSFHAPMDHEAMVAVEPTGSPDTGDITALIRTNYAFRPLVLRDASGDVAFSVIEHQLSADFAASIGLGHCESGGGFTCGAFGIDIPAVLAQTGDDPRRDDAAARLIGPGALPLTAIGDPALVGKWTLIQPSTVEPSGGLALKLRTSIPFGGEASYTGEGGFTFEPEALGEFRPFDTLRIYFAAGAKVRTDQARLACAEEDDCPTRFGHAFTWATGVVLYAKALGIDDDGRAAFSLEGRGYQPTLKNIDREATSGNFIAAGFRYAATDVVGLFAGVEGGFNGIGSAPIRGTLGLSFAPHFSDEDGDGLDKSKDRCPDLAEDKDGVEDADGCPEANPPG